MIDVNGKLPHEACQGFFSNVIRFQSAYNVWHLCTLAVPKFISPNFGNFHQESNAYIKK